MLDQIVTTPQHPTLPSKRAVKFPRGKEFKGVDVVVEWHGGTRDLADELQHAAVPTAFRLEKISNRSAVVWPEGKAGADPSPFWTCRFFPAFAQGDTMRGIPELLKEIGGRLHWTQANRLERWVGATVA